LTKLSATAIICFSGNDDFSSFNGFFVDIDIQYKKVQDICVFFREVVPGFQLILTLWEVILSTFYRLESLIKFKTLKQSEASETLFLPRDNPLTKMLFSW